MHDQPRQTLREIVDSYGLGVLKDPRRCRALMMDFCGDYRGEINLVEMALREGIVEELQSALPTMPRGLITARLAQRLRDAYYLPDDAALWAVETCASALEIRPESQCSERILTSNVPVTVYVRPWLGDDAAWREAGRTPGDVVIPADVEVRVSARLDDAAAAQLAADMRAAGAIHQLDLSYSPITDAGIVSFLDLPELAALNLSRTSVDDTTLGRLGESSVRALNLWGVETITDRGLAALGGAGQIESLELGRCPRIGDDGLYGLRAMSELRHLGLSAAAVSDRGLRQIGRLPSLRSLDLSGTGITGRGLGELAGSNSLSSLDLSNCVGLRTESLSALRDLHGLVELQLGRCGLLTDQALMHLRPLSGLQGLNLEGLDITDAGLLYLGRMTALTNLDLSWTPITDQGVARLSSLRGLQVLSLSGTVVTDGGTPYLAELHDLVHLDLSSTLVTDAGLRSLRGLTSLVTLDLEGTQVRDAGLVHLGALAALSRLYLGGTAVSDVGLELLSRITRLAEIDLTLCANVSEAGIEFLSREGTYVAR